MKVTGQQPAVTQDVKTSQTQKNQNGKETQSSEVGGDQSVKTSSFMMDKMKSRITTEPEVRADKVAELKAKIASGDYKVNAEELAGKMLLDSLQEDLG